MTWYGGKEAGERAKRARHGARRRAREKAADVGHELTLDELYARDRGLCHRCKLPVHRDHASKDHVIPLARGGARDESNEKLAHKRCNSSKGASTGPRKKGLRRGRWARKPKSKIPEGVEVF